MHTLLQLDQRSSTKKFLLTLALIAAPLLGCLAQSPSTPPAPTRYSYASMRVFEALDIMHGSSISITYDGGETEKIELKELSDSNREINSKKIHEVLTDMLRQGYEIIASSGGVSQQLVTTTYIIRRPK